VVDRERAIEAFRPQESWSLDADLAAAAPPEVRARLVALDGRAAAPRDERTVRALEGELSGATFTVAAVERTERRRHPPPPFTTAKLQQEAARRLGFSPKKTMTLAQRLYEGVELGEEGLVGLVTYMRTDSVRLSTEAVDAARAFVGERFGADHLPDAPNVYRGHPRAQEAHEAVRPTAVAWTPERVAPHLTGPGERDLARLYALVWSRFVACQMLPAVYDQTRAEIAARVGGSAAARATFRVTGAGLRAPGYLAVYGARPPEEEVGAAEEPAEGEGEGARRWEERALPPLEVGMPLRLLRLSAEQHFSQPPPRHDEASLVRELEERGIGRPSTYASILETIQEREYVEKVERTLRPTPLGALVTDELVRAFPHELDPSFTAGVEEQLDAIEDGSVGWQDVLARFHGPFEEALERAKEGLGKRDETGIACPKCGKTMAVKFGRNGEFLACPGYPACRSTMNFRREGDRIVPEVDEAVPVPDPCPLCGGPMVMKRGRYGKFIACTRYPACKGTRPVSIGVECPKGCGGYVSEKRARTGRTFYGCSSYPACDFVAWDRPRSEPCPDCGNAWLVEKVLGKVGPVVACPNRECGYRRDAAAPAPAGR
jgi:DNA topoisomerase-1